MKLDLNFSGATKLKEWWNIVKSNFTLIQDECASIVDAVNAVTEKADNANDKIDGFTDSEQCTKVSQIIAFTNDEVNGIRYDIGSLSELATEEKGTVVGAINSEARKRKETVANLENELSVEKITRKKDTAFLTEMDNTINANLFGAGEHNLKCVLPSSIPVPYFTEGDEYYGETLTVDVTTDGFVIDDVPVSSAENWTLQLSVGDTSYITASFDTRDNSFGGFSVSTSFVESTVTNGIWQFTVYEYRDFDFEFKVSSDSPTGDLYILTSWYKGYASDNADARAIKYIIEQTFTKEGLDKLKTENKASVVDAVNELCTKIYGVETNKADIIINTASGKGSISISDAAAGNNLIITGNTVQNGTPTPDTPVEIKGVTKVTVNGNYEMPISEPLYGQNFIDCNTQTVYKNYACYTLTGEENNISLGSYGFYFTPPIPKKVSSNTGIFCTHYQFGTSNEKHISATKTNSYIYIKDDSHATVEDFKKFLKENSVSIIYPIDTVTESIFLKDTILNKGENTIQASDGENNMTVSVEYAADTKLYIDNKFSELQTAILSEEWVSEVTEE